MKFKIPVLVEVSTLLTVEAKDLNEACFNSSKWLWDLPTSGTRITECALARVDQKRLNEMYPAETEKMRKDAMPYWEKKGWHEDGVNQWSKGNAIIENTFDDVGFGFRGTVWIGRDGKSGFDTLKDAIDWAEEHM